jgi:hypothetical protein
MKTFQIIILVLCVFGFVNLSSKANVTQNTLNNARVNKAIYLKTNMFMAQQLEPKEIACYCDSSNICGYGNSCPTGKAKCTPNPCSC